MLTLDEASHDVSVRRAQRAVDLAAVNPEADETANIFFAAPLDAGAAGEFRFRLTPAAQDFERRLGRLSRGVVFVSAATPAGLSFLPLDESFHPVGSPLRLTDQVVLDPRRRPEKPQNPRAVARELHARSPGAAHRNAG